MNCEAVVVGCLMKMEREKLYNSVKKEEKREMRYNDETSGEFFASASFFIIIKNNVI